MSVWALFTQQMFWAYSHRMTVMSPTKCPRLLERRLCSVWCSSYYIIIQGMILHFHLFTLMLNFYHMITNIVIAIFNKDPISQPWYWYPHAGQQLHKTRHHCPPPKWKWNFGTGKMPTESFLPSQVSVLWLSAKQANEQYILF